MSSANLGLVHSDPTRKIIDRMKNSTDTHTDKMSHLYVYEGQESELRWQRCGLGVDETPKANL